MARIQTPVLDIAYEASGPAEGLPVLLLHGFPYDVRAFDAAARIVNAAGFRTIVPWLRGYGGTRFLSAGTPRSGEQAALGQDLKELLDALGIQKAVLGGYDWGGRAACVVSALWPERVAGLVSCAGYTIQDIPNSRKPADPEQEARFWYQYYFNTERGRNGLTEKRREIARLLWKMWSPTWAFDDATFDRTASSFDNEDFVDVAIHSYRHRYGNAAGDPRYAPVEARLAAQPKINVPTINLHGTVNGIAPVRASESDAKRFTASYQRRVLENVGHNPPQEAPQAFAEAILQLCQAAPA
ncbi:MAG: alpha/beta hydrolase [Bradyrhizobium sp.]|uniref:alpha/beta fold hydrolase n=1 Tax=Bradyrhizobium sp. TaxID=376 RepID=UPI00121D54CD|nr:alpha/beta hydrolase [Bradyrhizobium sp.]THD63364.1 MAG: alpha/beta hydrolase [Bradyrhizobium sp.]